MSVLEGEIAVVTGAAQGIGEAVARALAAAGARVATTSWDRERAQAMADAIGGAAAGHAGFSLDIASTASVDAAAAEIAATMGAPTILVNSAGINKIGPAEDFTDEDWQRVLDVNLTGTFRCCRAFGRLMLAGGHGSIVNIGSIAGHVTALPGRAPYAASKAGVVGLTRVLAIEWAARGVRVNAILPGPVRTPMVLKAIEDGILDESEITDRTPAGRIAEPSDIAGAVVMLCTPGAGFVTGQSLTVDGGYTMFGAAHKATKIPDGPSMPELFGKQWSRKELARRVGRLDQVAGVRLVTLGDGGGRGVRLVEFRTGTGFAFDVIVDRAFDIGRCELRGIPLAWHSAVGIEGPWYYEPDGFGFFRTFGGGLLVTCGIEHTLFMATDTAEHYNYPPKGNEEFGLHGRVSNRPGRLTGYGERWDGDECTLWCEGEVQVAALFGEQLLLRRRIEARVGESRLRIHDVVENIGHDSTPHMLLYHVNAGFPVVDEGSELLVAATGVEPRGAHSAEGYTRVAAPKQGFVEEVFEHALGGEPDGKVPAGIVNRRLGVGLYQVFDKRQLPHHFVWRMLRDGTYVVGIEPCTNHTGGRLEARERGELIMLEAGETREYDLELGALDGPEQIAAFAARVKKASA